MNKNFLIAASLVTSFFATAQEATTDDDKVVKNKKGHEILPKAGDIGLGFNAIPVMDALVNAVRLNQGVGGQNSNANGYVNSTNNQIVGKYFLSNNTAVRARVSVNTTSGSKVFQVQDAQARYDASFGTPDDVLAASILRVDDKATYSKSNINLAVGYEMRRGYRRLQGFYGGELIVGGTSGRQFNTYGNDFSADITTGVDFTNDFNAGSFSQQFNTTARVTRNLSVRERGNFRLGLRGFIGVEYFFAPKISVGAEYGWGYALNWRRGQTLVREVYQNGQNGPTVFNEEISLDSRETQKGFSVDNNSNNGFSMTNLVNAGQSNLIGGSGAITLMFHF